MPSSPASNLPSPLIHGATQTAAFHLSIPAPKMLTSKEELALLRTAVRRNPASSDLRFALALQLLKSDRFDELIDLVSATGSGEYRFFHLHAEALLARGTSADDNDLESRCLHLLHTPLPSYQRADVLSLLGKVYLRREERDAARACLQEALALNAFEKDAYKRRVALSLREEAPEEVLALAGRMVSSGITHSRVLCSQVLALAALGMVEEARGAQGLEEFLYQTEPAPPEAWTLQDFNQALAAEIHGHPDTRYNRYGSASAHTWRIDEPVITRTRLLPALQKMIADAIEAYVHRLPAGGHPFLAGRPAAAHLRNWCVITEGDGHETWHVHQNGWLSGVYYIHVQDHIEHGQGKEGCLAFGLPEEIVGDEAARQFGEVLCRPRSGLLMLFPSHTYHRTYPHYGPGRRICFAFDVIPASPEP
jgi:tetratricopeptide (TPR) repeat protein